MQPARKGTRLAAASLITAVLAGCASPQPAARPATTPLPRPPAFTGELSTAAVDLVTHSGSWPATERLLRTALNRHVSACMADKGFRYPAAPVPAFRPPEDEAAAVDLPERRRTGYGLATAGPRTRTEPPAPVDRYYRSLPRAEQRRFDEALTGPPGSRHRVSGTEWGDVLVPRQGCEAQARAALAGDSALWARITYIPEKYDNELAARIPAHPDYRRALNLWRTCMRERGHSYSTPESIAPALEDEFRTTGPSSEFRRREIATAVADGECALNAHIPAVSLRAQRALVAGLPESAQRTLAELAHYRDAAVQRARTGTHSAK